MDEFAFCLKKTVDLNSIWKDRNISVILKCKGMKTMVLAVFLCRTLKSQDIWWSRIEAFEMCCWRRLFGVSRRENQYWMNCI